MIKQTLSERILTGWNFQRVFYLIAGGGLVIFAMMDRHWVGAALGTYFVAMGIFGFGCASGNCDQGNCKCDKS